MTAPIHIKNHPLLWYFTLSFAISWGLIMLLAGPTRLPIDPESSSDILPLLYVSMLFGPSVASLLLTWILDGGPGLRALFSRFFSWRVSFRWYLLALFATPLLALLMLSLLSIVSDDLNIGGHLSGIGPASIGIGIMTGAFVGLFEELGWTGFVIPRMLRTTGIFTTGLLMGVIWGLWHFILFWEADSFTASLPFLVLVARLLDWLPPFRILMVWMYIKTKSILLVILTHMSLVVTTTVLVPMDLSGVSLLAWLLFFGLALWILALLVTARRN